MLTSSANQYLRPEYLTPLPTTHRWSGAQYQPSDILNPDLGNPQREDQLDAKKSPLALLAQTCSQIGADSPGTKPLIPPLEKQSSKSSSKGDGSSAREKASPASSVGSDVTIKSSFKPYESSAPNREQQQQHQAPREKTGSPPEERGSGRVRTPASAKSSSSTPGRCASNQSASSPRSSPAVGRKTPSSSTVTSTLATESSSKAESTSPLAGGKLGYSPGLLDHAALKDLPLGTFKPVSTPGYLGAYPHFPVDMMASHLKSSPYISYARMKTPSGADTLVPVCRDPYCTGCQLSSHLLAASAAAAAAAATSSTGKPASAGTCPGGCAQCDHPANKAAGGGLLPAAAAAVYASAHAQLAASLASHLPYVCNWIAGGGEAAYCGKRFATSEELLQHLRSHTGLAESLHPLFHRGSYPTPPLSPLATARYHPYGKPTLLPPGFPLHPHPGLPPYFSPYSLYGQRHP